MARILVGGSPTGHPKLKEEEIMLVCYCSLAGTAACNACDRFIEEREYFVPSYIPWPQVPFNPDLTPNNTFPIPPVLRKIRKVTTTYEYDVEGRVIKEIKEESEE